VLAEHGADVVLACRDPGKAEQAVQRMRTGTSRSQVAVVQLDLASLASVREAAERICAAYPQIALLVNNAGMMEVPYARTEDGFELTFATNHLGHFALTGFALAAHPGVVLTGLFKSRSRLNQLMLSPRLRPLNFWGVQNVRMGALPALRAATDPAAVGGEFYGPRRRFDTGYPARVESSARSHEVADQARLWDLSERLTGVSYRLGRVPA
jgi:NAD(P)-dependent dehydrogenase (short-subunit alcohol dehydrogenase family)